LLAEAAEAVDTSVVVAARVRIGLALVLRSLFKPTRSQWVRAELSTLMVAILFFQRSLRWAAVTEPRLPVLALRVAQAVAQVVMAAE
jgi:hypothetical protein